MEHVSSASTCILLLANEIIHEHYSDEHRKLEAKMVGNFVL